MSEGKSLRIQEGILEKYFTFDSYGALFPKTDALRTHELAAKVSQHIADNEGLERIMTEKIFSTDVDFAYRPDGSTPVIASGIKLFGQSPLTKLSFEGRMDSLRTRKRDGKQFRMKCERRKTKIDRWVIKAINTARTLDAPDEYHEALKAVEQEQVLTGGGYDNTEMFSITKSLLSFLDKCSEEVGTMDGPESKLLMEEIQKFSNRFWQDIKVKPGTLHFTSFMLVRLFQETDGMLGHPVYSKSSKPLTKAMAVRIATWSGVDCRHLVKKDVQAMSGDGSIINRQATVLDAMCYALDHMIVGPESLDMLALIWTLARIQRHGYKVGMDHDHYESKPGKARSVSPNAAFSAAQEAMSFDPLIKVMKENKCSWMPSLQDRATADDLIWKWYENTLVPNDMRALPADWSGYDKTVKGWILATILYYVVRPLYHFDSQKWVDLAIVSLVFKYFFISKTAAEAWPEEWSAIQKKFEVVPVTDEFLIVGTYNGLGSGAKLTHVGGSLYGELLIHHCIPRLLGYEGVDGPQAGDDTSLAVPRDMIDLTSAEKTYAPIAEAAAKFGLEMNTSKQMWVVGAEEVMNIFLQYSYNYNLGIKGIGTASRYYVAYPFAERLKFLTIGEQYMAILSKFNNGVNNPWIRIWVTKWLQEDAYICALFKYQGVGAFDTLIESTGSTLEEISERLELTWNWGLSMEQLRNGDVPIIPIVAEVAQQVSCEVTLEEAIRELKLTDASERVDESIETLLEYDDSGLENENESPSEEESE